MVHLRNYVLTPHFMRPVTVQLQAVAMAESIKETEFHTLLQFYHDLGVIVYYGGAEHCDPILRSTIILRPEWLVVMFTYVLFALPDPNKQVSA